MRRHYRHKGEIYWLGMLFLLPFVMIYVLGKLGAVIHKQWGNKGLTIYIVSLFTLTVVGGILGAVNNQNASAASSFSSSTSDSLVPYVTPPLDATTTSDAPTTTTDTPTVTQPSAANYTCAGISLGTDNSWIGLVPDTYMQTDVRMVCNQHPGRSLATVLSDFSRVTVTDNTSCQTVLYNMQNYEDFAERAYLANKTPNVDQFQSAFDIECISNPGEPAGQAWAKVASGN